MQIIFYNMKQNHIMTFLLLIKESKNNYLPWTTSNGISAVILLRKSFNFEIYMLSNSLSLWSEVSRSTILKILYIYLFHTTTMAMVLYKRIFRYAKRKISFWIWLISCVRIAHTMHNYWEEDEHHLETSISAGQRSIRSTERNTTPASP